MTLSDKEEREAARADHFYDVARDKELEELHESKMVREHIEKTVQHVNSVKNRSKFTGVETTTLHVRCPEEVNTLIEAAYRDAGHGNKSSWIVAVLNQAAKDQLGVYDVCDFDNHMARIGTATRAEYEAFLAENLEKRRSWTYWNGHRVVIK